MELEQIFHMNGGEGDNSYANNSAQQKEATLKAMAILQESLFEIYCNGFPDCIRFADMGCSSGPNSLLPAWEAIDSLDKISRRLNRKLPVLQVFLNDLPGNDFNTVFKSLPSFYDRLKTEKGHEFGSCFIAATPGSFYGRLFPPCFLHLVYSSYCLHWLSQVPQGLVSESGIPISNKGNVYVAKHCSPPSLHKVYLDQFESDFSTFLKFRSEELKPGGRMILTLVRSDKYYSNLWEPTGMVLNDMVSEGLIEESKLESFKIPFYAPSAEEARQVIEREGSFNIHKLETFNISWLVGFDEKGLEYSDKYAKGKYVAQHVRAMVESLLANHFGNEIMDDLFHRLSIKLTHECLETGLGAYTSLLISLIKKS